MADENVTDAELLAELEAMLREGVPAEPSPARVDLLRQALRAEPRILDTREADTGPATTGVDDPDQAVIDLRNRRDEHEPTRHALRWAAAAAVAAGLLGGGFALGSALGRDHPSMGGEVEYAGSITGDGADGEIEVVKIGIGRVVSLDTFDLPILPTSEYYEIWFVAPDDRPDAPNRISAGTFHPDADGRSEVTFAAAVDPAKYPVVEITAEPGDGNPAPTGPVVMRVQIAE